MTLDITLSLARAGHLEKPDAGKPEMRPHEPRARTCHPYAMKPEFDGTGLNDNLEPNGSGCSSRFRPFVASPLLADVAPRLTIMISAGLPFCRQQHHTFLPDQDRDRSQARPDTIGYTRHCAVWRIAIKESWCNGSVT
jgi:hypothetical protein